MSTDSQEKETTINARECAESVDLDELPRDGTYRLVAAYAIGPTEIVIDGIDGYYHALYLRDTVKEEHGYAGVSFIVEEDEESN